MIDVLNKAEIYRRMERYLEEEDRIVSVKFLAELAGLSERLIFGIFVGGTHTMSEETQVRMSRALERLERGDVTVMRNRNRTKYLQYNNTPKPRIVRGYGLQLDGGKISLKIGLKNKANFSNPTFKEQMERK
jgi:AraC-like DNA-binding protein